MKISDIKIFRDKAYINGNWVDCSQKMPVINPGNEEIIGQIPDLPKEIIKKAIDAAYESQKSWKIIPAKARSKYLKLWMEKILENKEDLAKIMSLEQGKNIKEAEAEIDYAASFLEWFAEENKRVYGRIIPEIRENQRILVMKEPVGVVGSITPWNFPAAMIIRKIAPAIAAGCSIILKPSEETPFTALALAELADQVLFPQGVINVVTGSAQVIGEELCGNHKIRKISFTGSTNIGKKLAAQSASDLKRLSLELGGNAAFIVLEDADLDKSVEDLMKNKFRNNGQACIAANRVFLHKKIKENFLQKLIVKVKSLKIGDSLDRNQDLGPLINQKSIEKIENLLEDVVSKKGKILEGGKRLEKKGFFFEPTIIDNLSKEMEINHTEIFGPVIAIYEFENIEEMLTEVNNTSYGLSCYLYSQDYSKIWTLGEKIETGIIGFNDIVVSSEVAPFGGVKHSGYGREGGKEGIEEYLQTKYIGISL